LLEAAPPSADEHGNASVWLFTEGDYGNRDGSVTQERNSLVWKPNVRAWGVPRSLRADGAAAGDLIRSGVFPSEQGVARVSFPCAFGAPGSDEPLPISEIPQVTHQFAILRSWMETSREVRFRTPGQGKERPPRTVQRRQTLERVRGVRLASTHPGMAVVLTR